MPSSVLTVRSEILPEPSSVKLIPLLLSKSSVISCAVPPESVSVASSKSRLKVMSSSELTGRLIVWVPYLILYSASTIASEASMSSTLMVADGNVLTTSVFGSNVADETVQVPCSSTA